MIEIGSVKYTPKEFVIEIKDKLGNVKAKYAINDKDKYVEKLMDEHFVELSFELDRFEAFLRADYILFEGSKFLLRKDVTPVKLNEHRFKYKLKFESEEMLLKDADFYYLRQDLKEASFNLTTDADSFMQIVVDNANRYFNENKYKVGVIQPEGIYHIFFDKIKTYDALIEIAKVFEAEFLFDKDYNVHLLNKANISEEIELKTDVSIAKLEYAETTPNIPFNRIVSLGSTHNIDANYRTPENNEGVDAIYQKRLRIPTSKGEYIDAKENMSPEEVVEGVVVFDHIFPKRIGVVSNISTKEYTDTDEITGAKIKWNAYRYKDNDLLFKEEYLLEGAELRIVFKSGHLNGMDFAVRFNPDKYKEDNPKSQVFEIVRNEDYAIPLPNDKLCPQEGDTYILYGFDINLVNDKYIPEAEEELYEAAKKWLSDNFKDTKVYECPTIIKYFHDHNLDLGLGQRIKLVDSSLENGSRSSRIIGFEKKLINKYNAIYTIGDNIRYSNLSNLKEEVKNLKADQYYIAHEASNKTPVITQYDTVKPTDRNVYSALMSLRTFHRKDITDETDHLQKYNKGIEVGGFIDSMSHGKGANIDEHGNAQFESVASRSSIITQEFIFNRLQANESDSVYTESGVIESVNEIEENTLLVQFKKRWETDFIAFHKDDILRGVVNTLTQGGSYYTSYVRVLDVNTSSNQATILVYPDSEVPAQKNYLPAELMIMHRWGNVTDIERQTTWFTSSREGRMVFLQGVNKPILTDNNYGSFWGLPIGLKVLEHLPINPQHPYLMARGIIYQDALKIDRDWNIVPTIVDRLDWKAGEHYSDGSKEPYEIHEVWHNGCKWRCLVDGTTQEPRWNATDWVLISGDSRLSLELSSSNGTLFRFGEVSTNFIATVYHGPNNITADIKNYDWEWTRDTGNINADKAWNEKNRDKTDILAITNEDVGVDFIHTRKATFICRVFVRQGENIEKLEKEIKL